MYEYTLNNHFKFGYGDKWSMFKDQHTDKWKIQYGKCSPDWTDEGWKKECIKTAGIIKDKSDILINICFSGGLDSEIVVRSFMDVNTNWFVDSGLLFEYMEKTHCPSVAYCCHMWLVDQIDGLPVMGFGEFFTKTDPPSSYIKYTEVYTAMFKHFMIQDRPGIPYFFHYNIENICSFLNSPEVQSYVSNNINFKYEHKIKLYKQFFPTMRYRKKYHGLEKIKLNPDIIIMKKKYKHSYEDFVLTSFDEFWRMYG